MWIVQFVRHDGSLIPDLLPPVCRMPRFSEENFPKVRRPLVPQLTVADHHLSTVSAQMTASCNNHGEPSRMTLAIAMWGRLVPTMAPLVHSDDGQPVSKRSCFYAESRDRRQGEGGGGAARLHPRAGCARLAACAGAACGCRATLDVNVARCIHLCTRTAVCGGAHHTPVQAIKVDKATSGLLLWSESQFLSLAAGS